MINKTTTTGVRRLVTGIARAFGLFAIALTLLLAALLLGINLPPVTSFLVARLDAALADTFRGRVVLHRIGNLSLAGVGGADLEVFDPAGHSVLHAEDIDVWLSMPAFAYHALFDGQDALRISIEKIDVRRASVTLFDDGTGTPTLAQAFAPKEPPPAAQKPSAPPELTVDRIALGQVELRGGLAATGPLEVDLSSLDAQLSSGARGLELTLRDLEIAARRLPRVKQLSGHLSAGVFLPSENAASAPPAPSSPPEPSGLSTQTYALRAAPAPRRVDLRFKGEVAGSAASLEVHLLGTELHAALGAPELAPALLSELAPGFQPTTSLGLSAQLDGPLEALGFEARLRAGKGLATLRGQARMRNSEPEHVSARLEGSDLDFSALSSGAPKTRVRFTSEAQYDGAADGGHGSYRLLSSGSKVGELALPDMELTGTFEAPRSQPLHGVGKLKLTEPGAPTEVDYEIEAADSLSAQLSAKLEFDRPARLKALTGVSAAGSLVANVRFDGGSEQLDADFGLRLHDLVHPQLRLRRLSAAFVARGALRAPELRLSLDSSQLQLAGRTLAHFWLRATGTPERVYVTAHATGRHPDQVDLNTVLVPGSKRLLRAPFVLVKDGRDELSLAVEHIDVEPRRVRVAGLALGGPGSARGSFVYGRELEQLDLETHSLDVARVLSMLGLKTPLTSTQADLDVHLASSSRLPSGKIRGQLREVAISGVSGSARADLSLEHGRIDGTLALDATDIGNTRVTFESLRVPLHSPTVRDLEALSGEVSLEGEAELSRLAAVLPLLGVERGEGHVRYHVSLRGAGPGAGLPAWQAQVESRGLVLVGQRADTGQHTDADRARQAAPWSLRGMDFDVHAALAERKAILRGRVFDGRGSLVHFDASWQDLLARSAGPLAQRFLRAPFEAKLQVPERELESLPEAVRPAGLQGAVALDLEAHGTLADPTIRARARVPGFAASRDTGLEKPTQLDLVLEGNYAPSGGDLTLKALRGTQVLSSLQTNWSGDMRRMTGPLDGASPIRASVDLDLDGFPLDVVPELATRDLRGELSGRAHLEGLGKDARLDLALSSHNLVLSRAAIGDFETTLHGGGGTLDVRTRLSGAAGKVRLGLSVPLSWGAQLVPSSDGQVQGSLETEGLRLSLFQSFVAGSIGQLGGKLDSSFTAARSDGEMRLSGRATLTEGVVDVPNLGQRFTDIGAEVELNPGQLRIEKLHARGMSGGFEASVQAELDGLLLHSAQASLRIKENDKLPITMQGETVGDVWGNIDAHYQEDRANQTQSIDVDLEKLNVELPATPPSGIATLEQPNYIRVGYFRRDAEFVAIDLQPLGEEKPASEQKTLVSVNLRKVSVRKGDQARVVLGGKVDATLADGLDVQGTIEAQGGELDVSGKTFEIERGTVSFTGGSPDDPTINAVARYDAPAGYTVYAEYVGTVRKGKLNLRAEPTLSEDEIVTLLLFGSPDGSIGSGNGDSLSTAVSVAGGAAAQSLNRAISDVTHLDVSARVDTSTGAPRPELVLQLTPGTAAKVTQALGEPAPGESPDRTYLTLDLRLARRWSLSTTVGDRGASALDLIWRSRY